MSAKSVLSTLSNISTRVARAVVGTPASAPPTIKRVNGHPPHHPKSPTPPTPPGTTAKDTGYAIEEEHPARALCSQLAEIKDTETRLRAANSARIFLHNLIARFPRLDVLDRNQRCLTELKKGAEGPIERPVIKIALVGDTGAGKSSLANALLGTMQIAPSNSMGNACTIVPTEYKYRPRDEGGRKFEARVTYSTTEDFQKELGILVRDLIPLMDAERERVQKARRETERSQVRVLDEANLEPEAPAKSDDSEFQNSEAAWEKLTPLFPGLEKDSFCWAREGESFDAEVAEMDLKSRMSQVKELGTVVSIRESDPEAFADTIRPIITQSEPSLRGPEPNTNVSGPNSNPEERAVYAWPLIKRFEIFVDSPLLEAGVVLIDLPGQRDSSLARSEIAERYIDEVDCIILVLESKRALDSRSGDKVLRRFYRESQLNGHLKVGENSNLIIVCTKADDIQASVAVREVPVLRRRHKTIQHEVRDLVARKVLSHNDSEKREELTKRIESLKREAEWMVVEHRNKHLKKAFARKLGRLANQDNTETNPTHPIYVVSSVHYQWFGEGSIEISNKYHAKEATEIPALRQYCQSFAINKRLGAAASFFKYRLRPVIENLLVIHSTDLDATAAARSEIDNKKMRQRLAELQGRAKTEEFTTTRILHSCVDTIVAVINRWQQSEERFEITNALSKKLKRTHKQGGFHGATLRAIVNRKGEYQDNNLNLELIQPLLDKLCDPLQKIYTTGDNQLKQWALGWQEKVVNEYRDLGLSPATFSRICGLVNIACDRLGREVDGVRGNFRKQLGMIYQDEIKAKVKEELRPAYDECETHRGVGAHKKTCAFLSKVILKAELIPDPETVERKMTELLGKAEEELRGAVLRLLDDLSSINDSALQGQVKYEDIDIATEEKKALGKVLDELVEVLRKEMA